MDDTVRLVTESFDEFRNLSLQKIHSLHAEVAVLRQMLIERDAMIFQLQQSTNEPPDCQSCLNCKKTYGFSQEEFCENWIRN